MYKASVLLVDRVELGSKTQIIIENIIWKESWIVYWKI
jgi:hypothetical protein